MSIARLNNIWYNLEGILFNHITPCSEVTKTEDGTVTECTLKKGEKHQGAKRIDD